MASPPPWQLRTCRYSLGIWTSSTCTHHCCARKYNHNEFLSQIGFSTVRYIWLDKNWSSLCPESHLCFICFCLCEHIYNALLTLQFSFLPLHCMWKIFLSFTLYFNCILLNISWGRALSTCKFLSELTVL